jgi:hypothetical protein
MENNNEIKLQPPEAKIRKCLKSYLTAKKYMDSDLDKSFEYFKQCVRILEDLKNKKQINDNFINLIDETETECAKYISKAIESTLDKPIQLVPDTDPKNELFEMIETGDISKLKNLSYGTINLAIFDSNGLTPLHWAIRYGDTTFLKLAFKLGAQIDQTTTFGRTLLEFACLEKDPNMINFMISNGGDMKKHLKFRESKKYFNGGNQIDVVNIQKQIMDLEKSSISESKIKLNWLYEFIKPTYELDLSYCEPNNSMALKEKIKFEDFIKKLEIWFDTLDPDTQQTIETILREELAYTLINKLGCPINKIEILLYNLVPFINYESNLKLSWLIGLEVKYIILKILKNKVRININEMKNNLAEILYISYIKPEIIPEGMMKFIVQQWMGKIKV